MKALFKSLTISLFFLFFSSQLFAQILTPVKWTFSSKKISDNEAELYMKASIENNWHLYSQILPPGCIALPTEFKFDKSADFQLIGKVVEPKAIDEYDKTLEMKLKYFIKSATFKQKIKIFSDKPIVVKGVVNFMSCDDKQCTPPTDEEFSFKLEGAAKAEVNTNPDTAKTIVDTVAKSKSDTSKVAASVVADDAANKENNSWWGFFLLSFLAGLAAILTPCVFPMIPMTVTFFMGNSDNKGKAKFQALVYGFSIIAIYTLIGTILAIFLGPNFANWLSTNWVPNVFFFLIFIFFAASFLGMFEITLPSWMVNKTDKQVDKGGLFAPFFMAFTLVLVSFSCTGPIVGAILVQSAGGEVLKPIIGMFGFSLAFALPFTLFAFFPSLLSNLPKSGGWLNSVKVVLGFLELALGLKFLSIADQTYHWGILDREVYLAFWIVIFALMGLYLLGKLKFMHDSEVKHVGVPRLALAIITFTFVVYMIPGMFGAPLKALSGYLPPQQSHDFDLVSIIRESGGGGGNSVQPNELCEKPKFSEFLHLPHGLKGFFDYDQGVKCAKDQKKPIFIDFTGHGCVNCREMEANVWSDPRVLKILKQDYVIVTLYVDDKTDLPEKEWITSTYDKKVKKTIGKKFADFQISKFNVNAQPYYVLVDPFIDMKTKEEVEKAKLAPNKAYDLNPDNFVKFLEDGVKEFKKRNR